MEQIKPIKTGQEAKNVLREIVEMASLALDISIPEAMGRVIYSINSKILEEFGHPNEAVFKIASGILLEVPTSISSTWTVEQVKLIVMNKVNETIKNNEEK